MRAVTPPLPVADLYRQHHSWLLGWLRRKVGCSHQAADLTQDTFVRVLGARDLDQLDEPRAFLMTLAQRVLVSYWRRRSLELAWLEALAQLPEHHAPSAEDYAMVREAIETLDTLLDGLPLRARKVFLMNRLEEMPHSAIAKALGISVATVERDMKRAVTHCYLSSLEAMPQDMADSLSARRP